MQALFFHGTIGSFLYRKHFIQFACWWVALRVIDSEIQLDLPTCRLFHILQIVT